MELLHVVAGMQTDIGIIAERCSRNAPLVQFPETVGLESGGHSSQRDLGIGLDLGQVLLHLGIALGHGHQLLAGTGDGNLPTPQNIRHRGVGTLGSNNRSRHIANISLLYGNFSTGRQTCLN